MSNNHIVIMAGGVGSRLFPLSTPDRPKQFIDLLGTGRTLIRHTVERFMEVCPIENFWVVTSEKYAHYVREQVPGIPTDHILMEPEGRNTAPCIAYACTKIAARHPDANVVVTPSDAFVVDTKSFAGAIRTALEFTANGGRIVTIGISPTRPDTGYGYICAEGGNGGRTAPGDCAVLKVSAFKEKPSEEVARQYLAAGNYLWNAGIFVWNVNTIVAQLRRYAPSIMDIMDRMAPYYYSSREQEVLGELFPQCEKISIDYAVMEKSSCIYTVPSDPGWSDLGSFASILQTIDALKAAGTVLDDTRRRHAEECLAKA